MNLENFLTSFYRYEKVRRSGKYNMITEPVQAAKAAHLDISDYRFVMKHYSRLTEIIEQRYGSVDKFIANS